MTSEREDLEVTETVTVREDDLRLLMEYAGKDIPVKDGEHEVNIALARCAEALDKDGSEGESGTAPEPGLGPGDCEAPGAAQRVGEAVRAARQRASLSQSGLAAALGVTQTAVSYWESGKRGMGIGDLVAVAGVLGVPAVSLLPQDTGTQAAPESGLPPGRYARIEIPGFRQNTGWVTEETRFGVQCAVVRDWSGVVEAEVVIGPGSRVVYLPTPLRRPEAPPAIGARPDDAWLAGDVVADDHIHGEEGGEYDGGSF